MHMSMSPIPRDGREIRRTCESEGDGGELDGRTRGFVVCARGGVSDVESGNVWGGEGNGGGMASLTMRGASWHRLVLLLLLLF